MIAVKAEEPVKALRERRKDGLSEVPSGISSHESAVATPGIDRCKDGEHTDGSRIYPDSDSGIDARPIDVPENGQLLKPFCQP